MMKEITEENRVKRLEAARMRIAKLAAKLLPEQRAELIANWNKGAFRGRYGSKPCE